MRDESESLRLDRQAADDAGTRAEGPHAAGAPCVVAKTKTVATYPTVAARFYSTESQVVLGTEAEGGAGSLTGAGDTVLALNLGTAIPPPGTVVLLTFAAYRWVFRYDG